MARLAWRSILLAGLSALPAQAAPAGGGAPVAGGTLIYLEKQPHRNLYPPAGGFYPNGGILNQITDRLTWQDPRTLRILPWIAQSWTVNDAYTEFTFHIRRGVTFSDGTPLDAAVVARNFDIYGKGDRALKLPPSEVINNYDHSEVVDPYTVRFYFTRSSPGFLQGTSVIGSGLVSLATLRRPFDDMGKATAIVGSGPFVVSHEILGKEVDLVARGDYAWAPPPFAGQGRARLDAIRILVVPEDSIRIGALLAGQADFIRQVEAYDEEQVALRGYDLYAQSTRGVDNGLAFRPENPIVADLRVRQALLHATDRKEIADTLYSVHYPVARGLLAGTAAGFTDLSPLLTYDPALARHLLDEAGWRLGPDGLRYRDGQKLVLGVHESLPQPQSKTMLELIAQQWRRMGVQLNVMSGSAAGVILDNLNPLRAPVAPAEVGRADPDVVKSMFYPRNRDMLLQRGGQSTKVHHFLDPALNGQLDAVASATDPAERLRLLQGVQAYILQQAYYIPIFEEPQVYAGARNVRAMAFEAVGRPWFYPAWLAHPAGRQAGRP
ncbi:TIGR04028 family ABC transporter substrate-binding protein [Nguyenibacter sp. L1]|uniref:TIGR04028 family ABC transporter substrate-binding protein n=1 Tax=Nguyenibacter sp. L1 TaxID=3049350 RepID=UPI002B45A7C3|nr:TIGR04028 family ABC transporter substrate-binding protein [Nguyenibacter sp. L1]WRH88958.1 TIGR04028 family ABC transporter substrate-binding protein [Nguyenibacter sp. L1]